MVVQARETLRLPTWPLVFGPSTGSCWIGWTLDTVKGAKRISKGVHLFGRLGVFDKSLRGTILKLQTTCWGLYS